MIDLLPRGHGASGVGKEEMGDGREWQILGWRGLGALYDLFPYIPANFLDVPLLPSR